MTLSLLYSTPLQPIAIASTVQLQYNDIVIFIQGFFSKLIHSIGNYIEAGKAGDFVLTGI